MTLESLATMSAERMLVDLKPQIMADVGLDIVGVGLDWCQEHALIVASSVRPDDELEDFWLRSWLIARTHKTVSRPELRIDRSKQKYRSRDVSGAAWHR